MMIYFHINEAYNACNSTWLSLSSVMVHKMVKKTSSYNGIRFKYIFLLKNEFLLHIYFKDFEYKQALLIH